jgi:hypothetical protein
MRGAMPPLPHMPSRYKNGEVVLAQATKAYGGGSRGVAPLILKLGQ